MMIKVYVSRFNRETDKEPHLECYEIERTPHMNVLDALHAINEKYDADIRKLSTVNMDISSHQIREWISEGRSCRYYLPDPVLDYIAQEKIYQEQHETV